MSFTPAGAITRSKKCFPKSNCKIYFFLTFKWGRCVQAIKLVITWQGFKDIIIRHEYYQRESKSLHKIWQGKGTVLWYWHVTLGVTDSISYNCPLFYLNTCAMGYFWTREIMITSRLMSHRSKRPPDDLEGFLSCVQELEHPSGSMLPIGRQTSTL